ncbi:transposase [Streptomyces phaeoluteigriseus]|uniref:transposase n=1 Tax=Streptomyces phaeoluteigriseus TaxID=114686 RepID=UPI003CCBCA6F
MTSHRARTWAPRGSTSAVRFNGASRGRIPMATLVCFKAGERSRLIYRPRIQGHHRGAHHCFTWQDYRDLLVRAGLQLGGPVVVIWDNLNVHRSSRFREYAAEHDWLTIVQLPSYAPDLDPVEGIWSLLRRGTTATSSSPTATTSSHRSAAACARSSGNPTSSTVASPKPASHSIRQLHGKLSNTQVAVGGPQSDRGLLGVGG